MIEVYDGNLFDTTAPIIAHQVNCKGVMGSGVAYTVRQLYPVVYREYKELCRNNSPRDLLGKVQIIPTSTRYIANIFGQDDYARRGYVPRRYTDYDALDRAFSFLVNYMESMKIYRVAMPDHIGCGRGGGDWVTVKMLLIRHFKKHPKITLELWKYEE